MNKYDNLLELFAATEEGLQSLSTKKNKDYGANLMKPFLIKQGPKLYAMATNGYAYMLVPLEKIGGSYEYLIESDKEAAAQIHKMLNKVDAAPQFSFSVELLTNCLKDVREPKNEQERKGLIQGRPYVVVRILGTCYNPEWLQKLQTVATTLNAKKILKTHGGYDTLNEFSVEDVHVGMMPYIATNNYYTANGMLHDEITATAPGVKVSDIFPKLLGCKVRRVGTEHVGEVKDVALYKSATRPFPHYFVVFKHQSSLSVIVPEDQLEVIEETGKGKATKKQPKYEEPEEDNGYAGEDEQVHAGEEEPEAEEYKADPDYVRFWDDPAYAKKICLIILAGEDLLGEVALLTNAKLYLDKCRLNNDAFAGPLVRQARTLLAKFKDKDMKEDAEDWIEYYLEAEKRKKKLGNLSDKFKDI